VIEKKCASLSCPLKVVGRDVTFSKKSSGITGTKFSVVGMEKEKYELSTPMPGGHQMANAACAVAAAESLEDKGCRIGRKAIEGGIGKAVIAGRFEVAGRSPFVILDGAHNPAGMKMARRTLEEVFPGKKVVMVFSACSDKDIPAIVREIAPAVERMIVTRHSVKERVADTATIAVECRKHCWHVEVEEDVRKALASARAAAGKDGVVLVAGSLYLVGDVKRALAS
jgi:dihydrofolate synthase/folylpolyglutamate synthase